MKIKFPLPLLFFSATSFAQQAETFPPPATAPVIYAISANEAITVDGELNELTWSEAPVLKDFFRMEPRQGGNYLYQTSVRAVFDKKNLYFGVFCKDSTGKKGIRVQDYRRDFIFGNNDEFFVSLDPQNLKRYCVTFHATPLATQRDGQVFDDSYKDVDWDVPWRVKSNMTDSGYYLEFAIPFSSLRYDKPKDNDSTSWGITYSRFVIRNYEQTVFPAVPQSLSPYRMAYAAQLKGLTLPAPSLNLRIQPYALYQYDKNKTNNVITDKSTAKFGGEIKWAINPHAVVDATVNTDFAQADADVAVNNLTRFNIFFPEKRQFFLENNGVFASVNSDWIRPYFSRTIGLENTQYNASAVPIDAGTRFTDKNINRTIAALYVHQRVTEKQGAANFGVLRYLKNYGEQNHIGVMFTHRMDEANSAKGFVQRHNTTATIDGLIRPNNKWSFDYFSSMSRNNTNDSIGFAFKVFAAYAPNNMYLVYRFNIVDEKYLPRMGYVYQNNVMMHNSGGYYIWRPKGKLSKLIRRWDPGMFFTSYQSANNAKLQSIELDFFPIWIYFKGNSTFFFDIYPTWEQFYFSPLGIQVKPGKYFYTQLVPSFTTDASKKLSGTISYYFGKYYDGKKSQLNASIRMAPAPNIAFTSSYQYIRIRNLGINKTDRDISLTTAGVRLALNPQIQASLFYQYNSFDKQGRWNVRGSWEFAPLSFFYIVFNDNSFSETGNRNQSVISKITYLKQF
ncbi:MAG TPA: DUF5916 domain-containing protein [Chitinophagaceae bacterium]|jgi:hypothetical protein|nr:DUF5916 domain-containing protein [Chitinophagaceae bacterium]